MRATIRRDVNHPSVIAWCLFNESWGLGGETFRHDTDAQKWVLKMRDLAKEQLDPSRLVDDNSPCRNDHVQTDLNSWHFFIDDFAHARQHIARVVKNTWAGSGFHFVPGRVQDAAPLINSRFGAVGPHGGDRDISWGLRCLVTLLRRHDTLQGYVYAQLTDVQREHNGLLNYDRSSKEFGYDEFVPGMKPADLLGPDFVGFDVPPVVEVIPNSPITVPIFVSHFSQLSEEPLLRWRILGTDDLGRPVATPRKTQPVVWRRGQVVFQKPLTAEIPSERPFVGSLALELVDKSGDRIAANFVNLVFRPIARIDLAASPVGPFERNPRVEVLAPQLVALRLDPGDIAASRPEAFETAWLEDRGKFFIRGGEVEYQLALPKFVRDALPTGVVLLAEMSAGADPRQLDWPSHRGPSDCPQTQERKHPSRIAVDLLGEELWEFELPDAPADSRGVLSHLARYEGGSHGYMVKRKIDWKKDVAMRTKLAGSEPVRLVFRVMPSDDGGGLCLFGERLGRYVIDPTLLIWTARDLKQPAGWSSNVPVTVNRLRSRIDTAGGIRPGEDGGHVWRYTTEQPPATWAEPTFDDSSWKQGKSGFGSKDTSGVQVGTPWNTPALWMRTRCNMPPATRAIELRTFRDEDMEIHVNGKPLFGPSGGEQSGDWRGYRRRTLTDSQKALFNEGDNVISVRCRQGEDAGGVDLGIRWIVISRENGS